MTVLGEKEFVRLRETRTYARAMKNFDENIKPGFQNSEDDEQYIHFPKAGLKDRPELGLVGDTVTVERYPSLLLFLLIR